MNGKQQAVAAGGLALIGVNVWTGGQKSSIAGLLDGTAGADNGRSILVHLGSELILVLVATIAAGTSDAVATGMVAAIVALWVIWGIAYYARPHTSSTAPPTSTQID